MLTLLKVLSSCYKSSMLSVNEIRVFYSGPADNQLVLYPSRYYWMYQAWPMNSVMKIYEIWQLKFLTKMINVTWIKFHRHNPRNWFYTEKVCDIHHLLHIAVEPVTSDAAEHDNINNSWRLIQYELVICMSKSHTTLNVLLFKNLWSPLLSCIN